MGDGRPRRSGLVVGATLIEPCKSGGVLRMLPQPIVRAMLHASDRRRADHPMSTLHGTAQGPLCRETSKSRSNSGRAGSQGKPLPRTCREQDMLETPLLGCRRSMASEYIAKIGGKF